MKKLFLCALLAVGLLPTLFAFGLESNIFFGQSNGFDVGVVFGNGIVRNSVGLVLDGHSDEGKEYDDSGHKYYTTKAGVSVGPFYRLEVLPVFYKRGDFSVGMDISLQIALAYDSVQEGNILGAISPAVKIGWRQFDFMAGYRGCLVALSSPAFTNSFLLGVRYNFGSRNVFATGNTLEGSPDNSSNPSVIVLPGSSIVNE